MAETFEIGVVMSGAISAGAYTAGVIDFLYQALDAYYEARAKPDWDGPRHDVRIPILTGASAGGMTAAIAGLHAFRSLTTANPSEPPPEPARNRLYSSWVEDIDISRLLETTDLTGARRAEGVQSALCCDVLDEIVAKAFDISGGAKARPWIGRADDPTLRLRLTLTNLRGVPYSFPLFGALSRDRFGMLSHADYYEFAVGAKAEAAKAAQTGATPLDAENFADPLWARLRQTALATGAFPVGLRPREIERDAATWYKDHGRVGFPGLDGVPPFVPVQPDEDFAEAPYKFVSVDGGTIDNDPLELARRYLAGEGGVNPRDGLTATKAVLLVSPFPSAPKLPPKDSTTTLLHVLTTLGKALLQQARFKPEELHLAADERVYSRFMISPVRRGPPTEQAEAYPIACGVLGGFGGFLHESFRRHDYLLGKRNAQAFLRWNFGLPEDNPLFAGAEFNRDKWAVKDAEGKVGTLQPQDDARLALAPFVTDFSGVRTQRGFPIIPLTPAMLTPIEIGPDDLPRPDAIDLVKLREQVEARAGVVIETLVDQDLLRHLTTPHVLDFAAKFGARTFGAHVVADLAMTSIKNAVADVNAAFYG